MLPTHLRDEINNNLTNHYIHMRDTSHTVRRMIKEYHNSVFMMVHIGNMEVFDDSFDPTFPFGTPHGIDEVTKVYDNIITYLDVSVRGPGYRIPINYRSLDIRFTRKDDSGRSLDSPPQTSIINLVDPMKSLVNLAILPRNYWYTYPTMGDLRKVLNQGKNEAFD